MEPVKKISLQVGHFSALKTEFFPHFVHVKGGVNIMAVAPPVLAFSLIAV
jgi:hypothetical protein